MFAQSVMRLFAQVYGVVFAPVCMSVSLPGYECELPQVYECMFHRLYECMLSQVYEVCLHRCMRRLAQV